jgi:glycosyltransferase involved in cell wall biosynthesis
MRVRVKTVSSYNTRWCKYDRDKLWLVYTQIVPVISEPPCITSCILVHRFQHIRATCFRYVKYLQFMIVRYRRRESELSCNASLSSLGDSYRHSENINCLELQVRGYLRYFDIIHIRCNIYIYIYTCVCVCVCMYVCMYVYIYTHKSKFYYQHIAQQISLFYMHRRLLQHISAISYSHFQETLIQNIKFNFVSSKG